MPSISVSAADTIALVGTPNCGKTTLFNALTGLRQKVANYPGVTVEKKEGFLDARRKTSLLDLPGLYSLNAQTPDEIVTRNILVGQNPYTPRPAAVLVILDGSSLDRSLAFAASVLALGLPTAACVTMFDEIKARGGRLDVEALSKEIGVPVLPVVGHRGVGIKELKELLSRWKSWPPPPTAPAHENAVSRYSWALNILSRCLRTPVNADSVTARIDRVVLHPIAGPLVFFAVMALFFQSIFTWAAPMRDGLASLFSYLGYRVGAWIPNEILRSFVEHALFDGVGSVVSFLPQILILFFFLFLIEDVGYMARAAFLMDRLMGWAGLQGRSFMALVSSYACAVPGIMATRTIPTPQDRLTTMLVAPFMTCSARLPVYALLIAAFIPNLPVFGPLRTQGLVLFSLYLIGSASALAAAWAFRSTVLQGSLTPFYMELPPYRFPALKSVALAMLDRAKIFLRRAGTIILKVSVIMWFFLSFPRAPQSPGLPPAAAASRQLQYSVAGRIGKAMEPVFRPLGFDWRINVGILASLPAREIFVSTLAQIYGVESSGGDEALRRSLPSFMTLPAALSILMFFVYALQCFSTLAIMRRETNGWRWPAFAFTYMFACAWIASFGTYRIALSMGL